MRFQQSEPKLQVNHFDGYATFIITQACGMRDEPQVHAIHLTEEQAREMACEILEPIEPSLTRLKLILTNNNLSKVIL